MKRVDPCKVGAVYLLSAGLTLAATAQTITADPDAFADTTDISNAMPNITLSSSVAGNPAVFSLSDPLASTGTQVFGQANASFPKSWAFDSTLSWGGAVLRVDFLIPVVAVDIDVIGDDVFSGRTDIGRMEAYDANDVLLAAVESAPLEFNEVERIGIAGSGEIAYVLIAGKSETRDTVLLDQLSYLPRLPGDLDGDCAVNIQDLGTLLSNFGVASGLAYGDGDLDGDGGVGIGDLGLLLAAFGNNCP